MGKKLDVLPLPMSVLTGQGEAKLIVLPEGMSPELAQETIRAGVELGLVKWPPAGFIIVPAGIYKLWRMP